MMALVVKALKKKKKIGHLFVTTFPSKSSNLLFGRDESSNLLSGNSTSLCVSEAKTKPRYRIIMIDLKHCYFQRAMPNKRRFVSKKWTPDFESGHQIFETLQKWTRDWTREFEDLCVNSVEYFYR